MIEIVNQESMVLWAQKVHARPKGSFWSWDLWVLLPSLPA